MGGFYSFRVYAPQEVTIIENFVTIDEGMNTFNCHVNDLPRFLDRLRSEDVRVDAVYHLDPGSGSSDLFLTGGDNGSGH